MELNNTLQTQTQNQNKELSRRTFLKTALFLSSTFLLSPLLSFNKFFGNKHNLFADPPKYDLFELEGTNYNKLIQEGFKLNGGISKFVKPGYHVVIKPNASWERTPEQAANTNPELLAETIRLCKEAGAKKIDVIDNPCDNWKNAFKISGIKAAVKEGGGKLIPLNESDTFTQINIEKAKILKTVNIATQILEADCFINMPIAKVHSAATLTMSMKNYMGVVKDRRSFHTKGLLQGIADISSYMKPDLIIMDCTRILTTHGPKGPGDVKVLNKIIVGKDHVAVDSLGSTYFGLKPSDIGYITIASDMNIGNSDLKSLQILRKKIV